MQGIETSPRMQGMPPPPMQGMVASLEDDLELVRSDSFKDRVAASLHRIEGTASPPAVAPCVETLHTLVQNIVSHPQGLPGSEKYRSLRKGNKGLQKKVFSVNGAEEFLLQIGFVQTELEDGEHLILLEENPAQLASTLEALSACTARLGQASISRAPSCAAPSHTAASHAAPIRAAKPGADPAREAIRRRIEADKRERQTRQMQDSRSQHKGFKAGERKTATELGADGRGGGG